LEQLIKTVILGVIQGLTEWLPISSSGHLELAERFLGLSVPLVFDVILHVGTLMVILAFFKSDVKGVLLALMHLDFKTDYGKLIPLIIVGTVPTAFIGLVLHTFLEEFLQEVLTIAVAFIACGMVLFSAKAGREKKGEIGFFEAFLVGVAQGIAVIPGLSRSGLTIATALLLGIRKEKAFKFSFLLSVPAVIGALALTLYTEFDRLAFSSFGLAEAVVGMGVALIVGYLALKVLWKVFAKGKFHLFAFYCWMLGISLIAAFFLGFL
jgi:undecaprenyl-diphosphatase